MQQLLRKMSSYAQGEGDGIDLERLKMYFENPQAFILLYSELNPKVLLRIQNMLIQAEIDYFLLVDSLSSQIKSIGGRK